MRHNAKVENKVEHEINEKQDMTWYGGDLNQNESYPKLSSHKFIINGSCFIFLSKNTNKKTLNTNKHTKRWSTGFPKFK
jgi:hypothetical protein